MSITSANPDDLEVYTDTSHRQKYLSERTDQLRAQEQAVLANCADFGVNGRALLEGTQALGACRENEVFVRTVRTNLLNADHSENGEATVADADLEVALTAAGVGTPPPLIVVEPGEAWGIPPTSGYGDDPICMANGNFVHIETDLAFPGWSAVLDVQRVYNSLDTDTVGAFGAGWSSTLDLRVYPTTDGPVRVRLGDGALVRFLPGGSDGRLVSAGARQLELSVLDDGWVLHEGHTKAWRFDHDGMFVGGTAGATTLVVRRDGDRVVELAEERSGRTVRFQWEGSLVTRVVSSDGREVIYTHEGDAIARVDRPTGAVTYGLDGNRVVSVTDADGVRLALNAYDESGRVVEQTNEFGRTTRYQYSEWGTTLVSDTVHGPRNAFTHDKRGNVTAIVDGHGKAMRLTYDDSNQATSIIDRDGARRRFSYDDRGNLIQRIDPDNLFAAWEWDELGRLVAETHRNRAVTRYEYEGDRRRPSRIIEPGGGTYVIDHDDAGLPVSITDPDGVVSHSEWNADGVMTAMVDGLGHRIELSYDDAGHPVRTVDGSGVITELLNDPAGRVRDVLIAGSGPSFTYTEAGRPLSGTDPAGVSWSAAHGSNGKVESFVDGEGSEVRFEWDIFGNQATVVAPDGARFGHRHDETGAMVAAIDAEGRETTIERDAEGRAIRLTDPAGRVWSREVDPIGRTTVLVAPDGGETRYTYHLDGQIARVRHPDGTTVTTEVNDLGHITAVVNEANERFEFSHSPAGRLTERRWPSGRTEQFSYDAAGRLIGVETVGRSDAVAFTLDGAGRVLTETGPDGELTYTYDGAGELIAAHGARGRLDLTRDASGWIRSVTRADGTHTSYQIDARGLVSEMTDPAGLATRFAYDVRGRLGSATAVNGDVTSYGYDTTGYLESITEPTATMRRVLDPTGVAVGHRFDDGTGLDRTIDPMGRTTSISADGSTLAEFSYDERGRLTRAHDTTNDVTTLLGWDPAGRLAGVKGPGGEVAIGRDVDGIVAGWRHDDAETRVELDDRGRLTHLDDSDAGIVARPARGEQIRDRAGRLLGSDNGSTYRYDDAGRLAEVVRPDGQSWQFTYSLDGLLESETGPDGTTSYRRGFLGRLDSATRPDGTTVDYFYDAAGRRVGATSSDGQVTEWFWDRLGNLVAIESRTGDGATTRTEIAYDALGRPFRVGGVEVAWDDALSGLPARIGERRYLHLGGRSMPAERDADWIDPPTDPWGAEAETAPHVGMHGHLAAAGLVWMGARVYDPSTREFLSPDPLAAVADRNGSASVYTYGWLDPINFFDPSGLRPISPEDFEIIRLRQEQGRLGQAWQAIQDDPWGTVALVGIVGVGVGLMFVPGGQVFGAGILMGAGSSTVIGVASGNFSPRNAAVSGAFGAIPGGNTVRGAILVGAATAAGEDITVSLINGEPINPVSVTTSAITGGTISGGQRVIANRINGTQNSVVDQSGPPTGAALHATTAAPELSAGPRPLAEIGPSGNPGAIPGRGMADHHVFPQQQREFFSARGIDIDQHTVTINHNTTHLRGVHGAGLPNHGMPGRWNERWSEFIEANPNASARDVYQFGGSLMDEYGLSGLAIHPYKG